MRRESILETNALSANISTRNDRSYANHYNARTELILKGNFLKENLLCFGQEVLARIPISYTSAIRRSPALYQTKHTSNGPE